MPKRARWLSPPVEDLLQADTVRRASRAAGRPYRGPGSAPTARPLERDIVKAIRDWLRLKGIWHWKEMPGAFGHQQGKSDILGALKPSGRFLAIEVKRPGGKPSEAQLRFLQNVQENGGISILAYSLEDVIVALKEE
jgi:hypothetical protein